MKKSNQTLQYYSEPCELGIHEKSFGKIVVEAIEEGLYVVGKSEQKIIFYVLERQHDIHKDDLPWRINTLTEALLECFGLGAKLIEIGIMNALHKKNPEFRYFPKNGDLVLEEYVKSLEIFLTRQFF